jgi:hypothetical protein
LSIRKEKILASLFWTGGAESEAGTGIVNNALQKRRGKERKTLAYNAFVW